MEAAPSAVRRAGAPKRISNAATIGIKTIRLSMRLRAEDHEVNQRDHACAEEDGVTLEIPELEEAQHESQSPDSPAAHANEHAINYPLVNESAQPREQLLCASDKRGVDLINVKLILKWRDEDRIRRL